MLSLEYYKNHLSNDSKREELYRQLIKVFIQDLHTYNNQIKVIKEKFSINIIPSTDEYTAHITSSEDMMYPVFKTNLCPGWIFGIWWKDLNKAKKDFVIINGKLFAQCEELIDKFKPSHSQYVYDISIIIDDKCCVYGDTQVLQAIQFIHEHPALAFLRDLEGYDYNTTYLTEQQAEQLVTQYKTKKAENAQKIKSLDNRIFRFIKKYITPICKDIKIVFNGEEWSPRYDIFSPLSKNKNLVEKPGCYNLDDIILNNGIDKSILNKYEKLVDKCKSIKNIKGDIWIWWLPPTAFDVTIINDTEYNNLKDVKIHSYIKDNEGN